MRSMFQAIGFVVLVSGMTLQAAAITAQEPAASASDDDKVAKYTDGKYDFSIQVAEPWKSAKLQGYTVPGVLRAAWSGEKTSSIVVFVQEPGQAYAPRYLLDLSAEALKKALGATIREQEVKEIDGKQAMWMVVEGKGTGGAIDGKGSVTTTQHWVAVPREKDIVIALLTSPTASYPENRKSFEKTLKTFKVGGQQTPAQSESR